MKYNFRIIRQKIDNEKEDQDDLFYDPYIDLIKMKCLDCDYQEEVEADIILECFDSRFSDYPVMCCPHCDVGNFVPEDVYDQIKGNFIYKGSKM